MKRIALLIVAGLMFVAQAEAIKRNPTGVSVNANGATTVFITFGELNNQVPIEAFWCSELISAAPDIGFRCDPATLFGQLPLRYDQSRLTSNGTVFTDIMSIPPSVARRAYQAAQAGAANSTFFYVRRFQSTVGGPDEFVAVTCRMAGGGARVPFALLDVQLAFDADVPVLSVNPGGTPPALKASIAFNGTGRLKGRWEVVLPGEEPPTNDDLLPEASLPVEQRGLQKRYTEVERFNVFLPPVGKYTLDGPKPDKLPNRAEGLYLVLLRVEAVDDKEADSDLGAAGAGTGIVHSGAVAGFPIPPLRYYVGSAGDLPTGEAFRQLLPEDGASIAAGNALDLTWMELKSASIYRVEVQDAAQQPVLTAVLEPGSLAYRAPSWLKEKLSNGSLRWRVIALGPDGKEIGTTAWRTARLE